jgi:hypothetical protein
MHAQRGKGPVSSPVFISLCILLGLCSVAPAHNRLVVDLNVGETKPVKLSDGTGTTLTLLRIDYQKVKMSH